MLAVSAQKKRSWQIVPSSYHDLYPETGQVVPPSRPFVLTVSSPPLLTLQPKIVDLPGKPGERGIRRATGGGVPFPRHAALGTQHPFERNPSNIASPTAQPTFR